MGTERPAREAKAVAVSFHPTICGALRRECCYVHRRWTGNRPTFFRVGSQRPRPQLSRQGWAGRALGVSCGRACPGAV